MQYLYTNTLLLEKGYVVYGTYSFFSMRHTVSLYKDNPTAPVVLVVKMDAGYNVLLVKDIVDHTATCLQLSKLVESKSDAHIYLITVKNQLKLEELLKE